MPNFASIVTVTCENAIKLTAATFFWTSSARVAETSHISRLLLRENVKFFFCCCHKCIFTNTSEGRFNFQILQNGCVISDSNWHERMYEQLQLLLSFWLILDGPTFI